MAADLPIDPSLNYRCVCGSTFSVRPETTGACPECGRKYTPQALGRGLAETVMLPAGQATSQATAITAGLGQAEIAAAPDAAKDLYLGSRLGHFQIESCLGRGGMGAVYQALDESLQRYVALKVIRTDRADDAARTHYHRLVQEARAQARVNHPNVVQIYFIGLDETAPYLAMELIAGPSLSQKLKEGPIPFADVVRIALQLTSAVERAAQYDIVHGDIKPSNILVADRTTVKIADFGLARSMTDGDERARGVMGTPNYLSPEAARGEPLDSRSDMYSLGVTLFELTFGRLPYQNSSGTLQNQLLAHIEQQPRFPEPWPVEIPQAWRAVLTKLLEKDRARRYASYEELRQDLRRVQPVAARAGAAVPRALAWVFDCGITLFWQGLLSAPLTIAELSNTLPPGSFTRFWVSLVNGSLSLLVLLAMGWLQSVWGSPGKKLFQLKVVDLHGLRPPKRVGLARAPMQLAPCLALACSEFAGVVGMDGFALLLFAAAALAVVSNAAMVLFGRQNRGWHDYLLRTRVVIDGR